MQTLDKSVKPKLEALQDEMLKMPQVSVPLQHYFVEGLYGRCMTVAAGVTIVGKVHTREHLCVVLKGKAKVVSDELTQTVEAPYVYISRAGAKRAIHVLEDLTWLTVHPTPDVCGNEIALYEEVVSEPDPEPVAELTQLELDKRDYLQMLDELGVTDEEVLYFSEAATPVQKINLEYAGLKIGESERHGLGVFATKDHKKGSLLCTMLVGGERTQAGRYTNHSVNPNCKVTAGGYILLAEHDIAEGDELTLNYREVLTEVMT
jgi:hypothetical protein